MICRTDDLIQYYSTLILLLITYGFLMNYFSVPDIGIYFVWVVFAIIYLKRQVADPIEFLGLVTCKRNVNYLFFGAIVSASLIMSVTSLLIWLKLISFIGPIHVSLYNLIQGLVISFIVAFSEEIVFRGLPLAKLKYCVRELYALILTSFVFSILHFANPGFNIMAFSFLFIASILLGKLYMDTDTIWISIGFHFTWNFLEGFVLGFPISGIRPKSSIYSIYLSGDNILTGSMFGLESSLISILIIICFTITYYLVFSKYIKNKN